MKLPATRTLAVVVVGLVVAALIANPALARALDPTAYFPDESAIPAGYVHDPSENTSGGQPGAAAASRWYQGSPGNINLIAIEAEDAATASTLYHATLQDWESQAVSLTPIDEIGDEAISGYRDDGFIDFRLVFFRSGTAAAGAIWVDVPSNDREDELTGLVRQMEARVLAAD